MAVGWTQGGPCGLRGMREQEGSGGADQEGSLPLGSPLSISQGFVLMGEAYITSSYFLISLFSYFPFFSPY